MLARPTAAVVLAAGQGTRMRSRQAKVLFEVGGVPLVAWPLTRVLRLGVEPVVVVIGHEAERVEAAVEARFSGRIRFALQAERLGTGHAARVGLDALDGFDGTVLILSGDVPLLEEPSLAALAAEVDPELRPLAVLTTELDDPTGYGRVLRDEALNVVRIVEERDASPAERACREVNAGVYAADARFLRDVLGRLSRDNAQGEYYLTDIVALALEQDLQVAGVEVPADEVRGANDRAQLAELERLARRRVIARHLEAGVGFLDPETTFVGPEVEIEPDATIHAGVHLRGRTQVGAAAVIDVGSVLTDAQVGPGVVVHPYTVIEGATVRAGAQVGPFGRLRPGADLGEKSRVGNFVEVKNTRLGPGAKANHLAYLGDAEVGANANVGAGTITCNYDGAGKHRTEIGEGTFIGSNSTLVAPLSLGGGSYVAAGSVVTESAPQNSLVFGRARQATKIDRASAVRAAAEAKKRPT